MIQKKKSSKFTDSDSDDDDIEEDFSEIKKEPHQF
jgi:hypothetical protein